MLRLGIDLGGTKIEIIALNTEGEELARTRIPTPQGDYEGTVRAIAELVQSTERRLGRKGSVGVGIPGALSLATGLVKNANSTCLIGHPLDRDLAQALGREVRLANDANCFTLSEAIDGAGADGAIVFGVILGTGVGGGIVVHRQVITGKNGIAGEWGHNPMPWSVTDQRDIPTCYCGKRGCIETFLSGPGLAADHGRSTGQSINPMEIAQLAETGQREARQTMERFHRRLAHALATVLNILDPDVVVLGGGLSNIESIYREVPAIWQEAAFSDTIATPLRAARHGDSSGVRGAAWLWPAEPGQQP